LTSQKRFGRYLILSELGRGAMGAVHLAQDPLIEREVAIKTLLPDLPAEVMGDVRERFLREARSAGRLNHPNIVTIFDVGEQDGVAYIAMEVLEGRSLQQMLRDPGRLPLATIVSIAAQMADALDHAQRFGIVHRDVKPANIMVSAAGRAKLTDFGVAHVPSSSMTQTGAALGSPKYMSPEQVTGQAIDPRSDIFSLGAVLYEMLVRRTPFEHPADTNVWSLLHRIAGERHRPVNELDAELPAVFDRILDRALAKSPEQRYQRAGDLANDLRNTRLAGASGTVAIGDEERRAPRAAPPKPAPDARLMEDLDSFAQGFERQEQERLRAEEQERLRRAAPQAPAPSAPKPAAPGPARRPSALELLKQKAAARPPVVDERTRKTESDKRIDARLRAAHRYLAEFGAMLRDAHPVSSRRFGLIYFGEVSGLSLCRGSADYRFRRLIGEEHFDYVVFKFGVEFVRPEKLEVSGEQLPKVRTRFDALEVRYEALEKKNDFGVVVNAKLMVTGPFPCQIVLRGDYDQGGFAVELENVERFGESRFRLGADELTDETLDELGHWLLGADDAFARFLRRGQAK
jgi:tRNA A-37 threonylcarbamoyl transferase component Bud32